jgi:hypothetical protein
MKYKEQIDIGKFCDIFYSNFQKLVPEHLRPRLSIFHVREMIKVFFDLIKKYDVSGELKPEDIKDYK